MSNVNTSNIDSTFPVQGQDNPSQGFRDNFNYIKIALDTAGSEITAIQEMFSISTTTDFLGLLNNLQTTANNTGAHLTVIDNEIVVLQNTSTMNFNSINSLQGQINLLQSNSISFLQTYTGNISASNVNSLGSVSGNILTVFGTTNLNTVSNVTITGGISGQVMATDGTGHLSWHYPTVAPSFTTSTLSTISGTPTGMTVLLTTAAGGAQPAFYDGIHWYLVNGRSFVI